MCYLIGWSTLFKKYFFVGKPKRKSFDVTHWRIIQLHKVLKEHIIKASTTDQSKIAIRRKKNTRKKVWFFCVIFSIVPMLCIIFLYLVPVFCLKSGFQLLKLLLTAHKFFRWQCFFACSTLTPSIKLSCWDILPVLSFEIQQLVSDINCFFFTKQVKIETDDEWISRLA